jgi:hypothetical protein
MEAMSEPHRLDGFDPDKALDGLRRLCREIDTDDGQNGDWNLAAAAEKVAELFSKLDHWLIVGEPPPAEWRWPEPGVAAERVMRNQPRRTTRAQRRR